MNQSPLRRGIRAFCAAALFACLAVSALPQTPYQTRSVANDVFYFFMPIAWRNGSGTGNYGDFKGMTASLPYLQSLGITAVWMTPIYPAQAYHGYHTSGGMK
jgi:hypothetical protein